jgi:hypothetical protein
MLEVAPTSIYSSSQKGMRTHHPSEPQPPRYTIFRSYALPFNGSTYLLIMTGEALEPTVEYLSMHDGMPAETPETGVIWLPGSAVEDIIKWAAKRGYFETLPHNNT